MYWPSFPDAPTMQTFMPSGYLRTAATTSRIALLDWAASRLSSMSDWLSRAGDRAVLTVARQPVGGCVARLMCGLAGRPDTRKESGFPPSGELLNAEWRSTE